MKRVFLDYNATAPIKAEVITAMAEAMKIGGNPSSVHEHGRSARKMVEDARLSLAALVDAQSNEIVFTAGGTEANNLALRGSGAASVIHAPSEHDSVLAATQAAELPFMLVPVDQDGILQLDALELALQALPSPAILSIMIANNETGVIQPMENIVAVAKAYGALVHTDASQYAGRRALSFKDLGVDMMTLTAHKMGGPQGMGALVMGANIPIKPLIVGGGQEYSRRSGTENVAGIVGFGIAASMAAEDIEAFKEIEVIRDGLEASILKHAPDAHIFGRGAPRLPNTLSVAMPGVSGETQVMHMDLAGIWVSSGSACSSGKVAKSHVLSAMNGGDLAGEAIRISFSPASTLEDAKRACDAWIELYDRTRSLPDG